jgi:hypothetical protein
LEETGLVVDEFIGEIPPFQYSIEKILAGKGSTGPTTTVKTTTQLNFVAKVAPISSNEVLKVTVDPKEHQNYAWASKGDIERYNITEGMTKVVTDALVWAEENANLFVTELVGGNA